MVSAYCQKVGYRLAPMWLMYRNGLNMRLIRSMKIFIAIVLLLPPLSAMAHDEEIRIVSLDSRITESLLAMDIIPVATTDFSTAYLDRSWLGEATDLGLMSQPNIELLSPLSPDWILAPPLLASITPRLSRVAAVENLTPYHSSSDADNWRQLTSFTLSLGQVIDRESDAKKVINDTEQYLRGLQQTLSGDQPPLLIIRLMDHQHARVFGRNSMFQGVLDRLGLINAWQGDSNSLGITLVSIDELMDIDARLVVLESPWAGSAIREQFGTQGLWQHLPSLQRGDVIHLSASFNHFGALFSARIFAEALVEALEDSGAS